MTHTLLAGLKAVFGLGRTLPHRRARPVPCANVMMHVCLEARHATALRHALIRDGGDPSWTMLLAALPGSSKVRLSLYLPGTAVDRAIEAIVRLTPAAEFGRLLALPDMGRAAAAAPASVTKPAPQKEADKLTVARILTHDHVLLGLDVADRAQLFERLGRFVEQRYGLPAATITACLAAREALGSTGLGRGIAIPHGHVKGLPQSVAIYARLAAPITFDAPDGHPVRDVVMLLVPDWANSMHLHLLADVAQRFCDHQFREKLHACTDALAVYRLFGGDPALKTHLVPA